MAERGVYSAAYSGAERAAASHISTAFGSERGRDLTRQNIFGVDGGAVVGIVRGQHWRARPPAVATQNACEQTFARLSWALRYYCVPCWGAFVELDENAECACPLSPSV